MLPGEQGGGREVDPARAEAESKRLLKDMQQYMRRGGRDADMRTLRAALPAAQAREQVIARTNPSLTSSILREKYTLRSILRKYTSSKLPVSSDWLGYIYIYIYIYTRGIV